MKVKDLNLRANVIKKTFDDDRNIISSVKVEDLKINSDDCQEEDIFITSDGDFIYLGFQQENFTEEVLARYVELAEELYENYGQHVSIYILCPKNIDVCVREFEIQNEAPFTIKLACICEDPCEIILNNIKNKIRANEKPTEEDLNALAKLHKWCKKEDRHYYLIEYLKILNRLHY